ncbi:MAG TPA: zinc ribbon domain-containing protein [Terriglobia bacterium]|nr:zinc ribbon domain-containing protein [Terriglobia bacterium]
MPIFEYICQDCGHPFERIVPRHDSKTDCAKCGSKRVEKQLSVFAVAGGGSDSSESFARQMSDGGGCGACGAERPGMCGMTD